MYDILFETLACLGGKRKKDSISFLSANLFIKHKKSGVKYTIVKVGINKKDSKPVVKAYRYYGPNSKKKYFILIDDKNFNKYEPV
jgi:hypothetical protein